MNNEREIDLIDLIFFVLEKWRLYVLAGCIGLVLLGAYKYIDSEIERAENEALIAEGREDEVINPKEYQAALDALDSKEREIRALEEKITKKNVDITNFQNTVATDRGSITTCQESLALLSNEKNEVSRKLAELQEYMDQSVLLRMDATAKPVAKKSYQVVYGDEGTETLFRDPVDEILAAYTQNISLIGAKTGLEEKYGVPEKYFDEVYSVQYDDVSNTITVQTSGADGQMAKDVLNAVCRIIEERKQGMTGRYHAHALKTIREEYMEVVDENLANTQSSRYSMVNSYHSQLANYDAKILSVNTEIDNANASIAANEQQIKDANDSIEELQADVKKVRTAIIKDDLELKVAAKAPSAMRSLKDGIKFGVIGAVVVAILAAGIVLLIYVFGGKMHTASELCTVYQLPLLAVFNRPLRKKGCFIDRWIHRMRNKGCMSSDEEILKTGAVVLSKLIGEEKKIAVLSSLDRTTVEGITEKLKERITGVEFVPVAESFCSAGAEELNKVDSVVLFEQRETSKLQEIEAELGRIKLLGKQVVGSIVS